MNIVLYTIGCPNCIVLETKLDLKGIKYIKVSDEDILKAKGLGNASFPILEVDGVIMEYRTALEWLKNI